jgi:hypothetical protein
MRAKGRSLTIWSSLSERCVVSISFYVGRRRCGLVRAASDGEMARVVKLVVSDERIKGTLCLPSSPSPSPSQHQTMTLGVKQQDDSTSCIVICVSNSGIARYSFPLHAFPDHQTPSTPDDSNPQKKSSNPCLQNSKCHSVPDCIAPASETFAKPELRSKASSFHCFRWDSLISPRVDPLVP